MLSSIVVKIVEYIITDRQEFRNNCIGEGIRQSGEESDKRKAQ